MRRGVLVCLGAAVLAACRGAGAHDEGGGDSAAARVAVRTAVAREQAMPQTVGAIGTVAPQPGAVAALSAPAATRVTRVYVGVGQRVARGHPLVAFDRAPFDAAAHSAEVAVTTARQAYERSERLVQQGILPRKDAEQAANDLSQAQANLVTARRARELATLRAPMDGVVTSLDAAIGEGVDPSRAVVQVLDPGRLEIVMHVSPADAALIRAGAAVAFTAGAEPPAEGAREGSPEGTPRRSPERAAEPPAEMSNRAAPPAEMSESLGTGVVRSVAPAVDSATRTVAVRSALPAPARVLRVGESVYGRITVAVHANAVVVPAEALVPSGESFQLFVVDSAGTAHARAVSVGARTGALAEITSGLRAGETVVTYGAFGVEDGARVVPAKP